MPLMGCFWSNNATVCDSIWFELYNFALVFFENCNLYSIITYNSSTSRVPFNFNLKSVFFFILDGETMRYGAIISTSNKIIENVVTVKCDGALLWMMGFCSTDEL